MTLQEVTRKTGTHGKAEKYIVALERYNKPCFNFIPLVRAVKPTKYCAGGSFKDVSNSRAGYEHATNVQANKKKKMNRRHHEIT